MNLQDDRDTNYSNEKEEQIIYNDAYRVTRIFWSTSCLIFITPVLWLIYVIERATNDMTDILHLCIVSKDSDQPLHGDWSNKTVLHAELEKHPDWRNVADDCWQLITAAIVFHSLLVIPLVFIFYGEQK